MPTPEPYQTGNVWQKRVYKHMADYLAGNPEIKSYGVSKNGNAYLHLLREEDACHNFLTPEIHEATIRRFRDHKAGDLHRVLTNTAASQNYCFNLVIYLEQHRHLADALFSTLLRKEVKVIELVPEFTPNESFCNFRLPNSEPVDESLGDQNGPAGTDADIGVCYTYEDGKKKGGLLIEFKFIEAEFSVCGSYHRVKGGQKDRDERDEKRKVCNTGNYFKEYIEPKLNRIKDRTFCGYTQYNNWPLTDKSAVLNFEKIRKQEGCPFRDGLNQLWRNMLLAEQVKRVRKLDDFGFWVFSPKPNDDYLWKDGKTEKAFREILTEQGNSAFKKIHLEGIHELLGEIIIDKNDQEWLAELNRKYLI
jgi:hypothetical protein